MRWLDAAAALQGQTFGNVVLIKLQLPDAVWVDGRPGWQRRGRRIARGASGIRVVAPTRDVDRSAGPVQGHGVATVWDISQTEGPRLRMRAVADLRPEHVFGALARIARDAGYAVDREPLPAGSGGAVTDHRRRRVFVSDDLDGSDAAMRLAHELAHLRMHKLAPGTGCHGLAKLEAESVAYTTLARFGVLPEHQIASATATIGSSPSARLIETLGGRVVATAGRLSEATARHLPIPEVLPGTVSAASIGLEVPDRELDRGL